MRDSISIIVPVYNVEKYLEKCMYRFYFKSKLSKSRNNFD